MFVEFASSVAIAASPGTVLAVLTDLASWPSWEERVIGRTIPDLKPSVETFARGLKDRAEASVAR